MEAIKIKTELRPGKSTKKELSEAREGRRIPGVVYGGKSGPVPVVVVEKDRSSRIPGDSPSVSTTTRPNRMTVLDRVVSSVSKATVYSTEPTRDGRVTSTS